MSTFFCFEKKKQVVQRKSVCMKGVGLGMCWGVIGIFSISGFILPDILEGLANTALNDTLIEYLHSYIVYIG